MTLVLSFYEKLNAKAVKRMIMETYTNNCIGRAIGWAGQSLLNAVPRIRVIRSMLLSALEEFLPLVVREHQRHQSVYSGQIIRGDCNWDIAQRIVIWDPQLRRHTRPYIALSAWAAVDGSLYQEQTPMIK